ncbi:MAG: flagellar protein FlaG [Variovorax sp.]
MSVPAISAADGQWWKQLLPAGPTASDATVAADAVGAAAEPVAEATPVQVRKAVSEVNASLQSRSIGMQFEVNRDIHRVIVKVVDRKSGEVIRQMPNEEVVRFAMALGQASGVLVSQKA